MGRARVVHPKFFLNEQLYAAEQASGLPLRLAFEGLWCEADREGRFEWKPLVLKLAILPWDPVDFTQVLEELERADFVRSYEHEGKRYGWIPTFGRWQKPHPREAKSRLPAPPKQNTSRMAPEASPRPVQGEPEANPRRAQNEGGNPLSDTADTRASLRLAQGTPKVSPGREKSAGLEDCKVSSDLGSSSDWRSASDLGTAEDSNGLSSLRTVSPDGLTLTPDQPVPEPTPEERAAFEQRRASVRAGLQDTLAQREQP